MLSQFRSAMSRSLKSLSVWTGSPAQWQGMPDYWRQRGLAGSVDYATENGDLYQNATCMTCISWMQRNLPKAELQVTKKDADGKPQPVPDHPLVRLFTQPNPHYSGKQLLRAVINDFMGTGDAFGMMLRGEIFAEPQELYYIPRYLMRPVPDKRQFISGYQYFTDGQWIDVDREDVIHFRFGINPRKPVLGLTPWASGQIQISSDTRGAIFSEALLRNAGAVGLAVAPKDPTVTLEKPDRDAIAEVIDSKTRGSKAGSTVVFGGAMEAMKLAFSPEEMALDRLLSGPADVICALVGLNTMLLGLPGGDQTRTFTNLAEARQAAIEGNAIPTLDLFGDDLDLQLLPEFENPGSGLSCTFDVSSLPEMQEDKKLKWDRTLAAVARRVLTVNEARAELGYKPIEGGDEFQALPQPVTGGNGRLNGQNSENGLTATGGA